MPDTRESVELLLSDVEQQLDQVDTALLGSDPSRMGELCADVRRAAIAFSGALQAALSAEAFDTGFRGRIETVARRLALQREGLARRSASVDRVLASLVRPAPSPTYSMPGARGMASAH